MFKHEYFFSDHQALIPWLKLAATGLTKFYMMLKISMKDYANYIRKKLLRSNCEIVLSLRMWIWKFSLKFPENLSRVSGNVRFPDVFRGYRKGALGTNGFNCSAKISGLHYSRDETSYFL